HTLELKRVLRTQVRVALDEAIGIQQVPDSFLGRLREMMIAMRTNALVPRELNFVHDFGTAGAFLPKPLRNLAFLPRGLEGWSFENSHGIKRVPLSRHGWKARPLVAGRARIRSASSP